MTKWVGGGTPDISPRLREIQRYRDAAVSASLCFCSIWPIAIKNNEFKGIPHRGQGGRHRNSPQVGEEGFDFLMDQPWRLAP